MREDLFETNAASRSSGEGSMDLLSGEQGSVNLYDVCRKLRITPVASFLSVQASCTCEPLNLLVNGWLGVAPLKVTSGKATGHSRATNSI